MALGRLKLWAIGELLKSTDVNAEFDNLISAILAVSTQSAESITPDLLVDGANVQVYFGEIFFDEVVLGTGLSPVSSTGLTITLLPGTAYILQSSTTPKKLVRVIKASATVVNITDNTVGFIDLGADGTFDISTNAAGAAADHTRLVSFTTSAGAITVGPEDVADRKFLEDFKFPGLLDNLVWVADTVTSGTIESGSTVRDSTNEFNISITSDITFDITVSGAGGLDQGSETSSTWYALLLISDSTGVLANDSLLVSDANFPSSLIPPTGYDIFRRIGWVRNDSSSDFLVGQQVAGNFIFFDEHTVSSAFNPSAFNDIGASAFVPPSSRILSLNVTSAVADNVDTRLFIGEAGRSGSSGGVLVYEFKVGESISTSAFGASTTIVPSVALNSSQVFSARANDTIDAIRVIGYIDQLGNQS